jgi:prophage regulatory protein
MVQRILRRVDVERATGLPRSTIYEFIGRGIFRRPLPLGGRSVGWLQTEVEDWVAQRVAARDQANSELNPSRP